MACGDKGCLTTSEFHATCHEGFSALELKRTVTSTDRYVQWDMILSISPDVTETDQCLLNLEATALTTEAPHVKKFVDAACELSTKAPAAPVSCSACSSSYGYYPSCQCLRGVVYAGRVVLAQPQPTPTFAPILAQSPLSNNFHFKITNVASGLSSARSLIVVVKLRHFKTIDEALVLSPNGPSVVQRLKVSPFVKFLVERKLLKC